MFHVVVMHVNFTGHEVKQIKHYLWVFLWVCFWVRLAFEWVDSEDNPPQCGWPLLTKFSLVKTMSFPVIMYECESWTIKKTEYQRIEAFELWCWRNLLRVPWTSRRSNQSILKEISPEYSLEGLMLKLKLQYFGHLIWRTDSLEKTQMLGKIEGGGEGDDRRWDGWMTSPTRWSWVWASSGSWWWIWKPGVLQSIGLQRIRLNWTECGWATSIPLWASMEQKAELGELCVFLPVSRWTAKYYHNFSCLQIGIYTFAPLVLRALDQAELH